MKIASISQYRCFRTTACCTLAAFWFSWAATSAYGVITWNVIYADLGTETEPGTGFGFDDPASGADRQATFESALDYVNTVVVADGTVDLMVNPSLNSPSSGTLASAGAYFFTGPSGFHNGFLFDHAVTGDDPSVSNPDAVATFNFGHIWNSDLSDPVAGEYDLFTVSLHEITHAMGFTSLVMADGTSAISGNAVGESGVYSVYDSLLEDGSGNPLFAAGGNFDVSTDVLTGGDVVFAGSSAVLANGNDPVPVYSPSTFSDGSSISHITPAESVMTYSIAAGVSKRSYVPFEIGILEDIGWTVTAIPEPSALLMMAVAVFSLGRMRERQRRG